MLLRLSICSNIVGIEKVIQHAGTKDQVEAAVQLADVEQAHLAQFEVFQAVPVAKPARMRKARLGKIDADDKTVGIIERNQGRL